MERETEIIYSPSIVYNLKQTDPKLEALTKHWEELMGPVKVTELDGKVVIKPCQQN